MTERMLSQVQPAEIEFLRRIQSVKLRDKVSSCEYRENLNVRSFLRIEVFLIGWSEISKFFNSKFGVV